MTAPLPFAQRDPRWGSQTLGATAHCLADVGDLVTAAADLAASLGRYTDPGRLNAWLTACGGYTACGLLYFGALTGLGLNLQDSLAADDIRLDTLARALDDGHGVLAEVDAIHRPARHWLRICAIAQQDCAVADPWQHSAQPLSLRRLYGLPGWGAACLLRHALIYRDNPARCIRFGLPEGLHQVALNVWPRTPGP